MRKINEIGKKSLTLLLAFIMVVTLVPLNMLVIAEDVDPETLIGSRVRIVNDMLYMYREAGSYAIGCDKSELPEVLVILDVETMAWGSTTKVYYKLGTVGRDSNAVLNTHSWTEDYNVQIIEYDEGNAPLTVDDMKVGKRYRATLDSSETSSMYLFKLDENGEVVQHYGSVLKSSLPQELTVILLEEGDFFVYVTNEDWPATYDDYRLIEPVDIIILECLDNVSDEGLIEGEVGLTSGGEVIEELTIAKGEKEYIFTQLSSKIGEAGKYQWQLLIDKENNRWANVADYCYPYATISEALIANACDEEGKATLRCIVTSGEDKYVSGNVTVTVTEPTAELSNAVSPSVVADNISTFAPKKVRGGGTTRASDEYTEYQIEVNYHYLHATAVDSTLNGRIAAPTVTITLGTGSSYTGTIYTPPVLGYKPYVTEEMAQTLGITYTDSNRVQYPAGSGNYYVPAPEISFEHRGSAISVMVHYIPQQVNFTVKIYHQNPKDDEYTVRDTIIVNKPYAVADAAVGEGLNTFYEGFKSLYYDPATVITGDGMTVVDIYYDREYYLVDFDLTAPGGTGYGVVPMYVRYDTAVMIGTPTNPGYTFDGWELTRVYTVDADTKVETTITNETIRGPYDVEDGGRMVTVRHNLDYKAKWQVATTSYTVIYWIENADDDKFTMAGVKVVNAAPGDVVSAQNDITDAITQSKKSYFTFNATLSDKDVTVKGDGTTAVNAYYLRNYYTLTFNGNGSACLREEHTHDANCPTGTCALENHTHTDACGVASQTCGKEEHKHTTDCCGLTEHIHSDACCNIPVHTHSPACCIVDEHTHINTCYAAANRFTSINSLTNNQRNAYNNLIANVSNPINGYVYRARRSSNNSTNYNFFYVNNTWYYLGDGNTYDDYITVGTISTPSYNNPTYGQATVASNRCSKDEHTHGDGKCTCAQLAHDHTVDCSCAVTAHIHGDGICAYTKCGQEQHTHSPACQTYNCGKTAHTHGGDCVRACQIPEHTHVATCEGTSTKNFQVITKKYGADIGDVWREIWEVFPNGERWDPSNNAFYDEVLVYLPFMPPANITFTKDSNFSGKDTYRIHYYLQSLGTSGTLYNGNYYDLNNTVTAKYGYLSKAEDFFDITGFTQYASNPTFNSNNQINNGGGDVYLYYTRKTASLTFMSNGQALNQYSQTLMYQAPIGSQYEPATVPYPTNRETNAVTFAGWYTTENCADGTEFFFDGNTIMPLNGLTLYAKWQPTSWNVKVYNDKEIMEESPENTVMNVTVEFGSMIKEPTYTKINENYIFAGWYYVEDGEEKRFDFNTMQVKKDYVIYAKWTSKVPVPYTIYYKMEVDGVLIEIADPTVGKSLAGISKTFVAKVEEQLRAGYREGYYPTERSHSLLMSAEHPNEITFYYEALTEVSYTVEHVFVDDRLEPYLGTDTFIIDKSHPITEPDDVSPLISVSFRDMAQEEIIKAELKAQYNTLTSEEINKIWTDIIVKLSPNAYMQELILVTDSSENKIIFEWADRGTEAIYEIVYKTLDLGATDPNDPNNYSVYQVLRDKGLVGHSYELSDKDIMKITGFTFYEAISQISGIVSKPLVNDGGLTLTLYFTRDYYTYTIDHYMRGTMEKLKDTETKTVPFESEVTENAANDIAGYHVVSESPVTVKITNQNQPIIFYYDADDVSYVYSVGEGKGVLSSYGEKVSLVKDPEGCIPQPNNGYIFAGWYTDPECTIPVPSTSATVNTTQGTNYGEIIPIHPDVVPDGPITFYAKIVPTSLTIQNRFSAAVNPHPALDIAEQGFIYSITGAEDSNRGVATRVAVVGYGSKTILGLPIGKYTITVENAWSWRYDSILGVTIGDRDPLAFGGMSWTIYFDGSDIMVVTYEIPGPDISGTTEADSFYFITDNANNEPN